MSPIREQLNAMIDNLTERDQTLLLEIVCRFLPDDIATPQDLEDITTARREYQSGETVSHEEINWD